MILCPGWFTPMTAETRVIVYAFQGDDTLGRLQSKDAHSRENTKGMCRIATHAFASSA
jgi:hypothetical protein